MNIYEYAISIALDLVVQPVAGSVGGTEANAKKDTINEKSING
jgi:hypothetical protein